MKANLQASVFLVFLCFMSVHSLRLKSSAKTAACYTISPLLTAGQTQLSPNNKYKLVMEENGNLALYRTKDNSLVWESGTTNRGVAPRRLVIRSDGNLAIYDGDKNKLWESGSTNIGDINNKLEVTNDGNIVLKNSKGEVVWSSKGTKKPSKPEVPAGTIIKTDGSCPANSEDDYVEGVSYVKIARSKEPAKTDSYLNFSQLEVFDTNGTNVAMKKPAKASSNYASSTDRAGLAVDGDAQPRDWPNCYCSAHNTDGGEWWEVDLQGTFDIKKAVFYNRRDYGAASGNRIMDFNLQLLDSNRNIIREYNFTNGELKYCINTI